MAWLGTWAHRVKLTIDAGDVTADLANFPVLVYISASSGINAEDISFVFDELTSDANRKKIAVTTSDGTTQCYVEIEKWDDANEKAWLHVNVPAVDADVNEDLYLYYDAAQADNDTYVGDTNSAPAASVWDANFVGVYHLMDGADTSHVYDSTSNNLDGTKEGAADPAVTTSGKVANAQDFPGDTFIDLSNSSTLNPTTAMTLEGWANIDSVADAQVVGRDKASYRVYALGWGAGVGYYFTLQINGAGTIAVAGAPATGSWHYRAATGNAATGWIGYYDGGQVGTAAWSAPANKVENTYIGKRGYVGSECWVDGKIDEVRISNILRPASYFKATYESQRDHFLDWGSEEALAVIPSVPRMMRIMLMSP